MAKELEATKVESRKEVVIPITLRGLVEGYKKIFHDTPVKLFQKAAVATDSASSHMMTGLGSAITMPLGIMLRNGSRVAHGASKDKWAAASISGIVGAGAAWWMAGGAAFASLSSSLALTGTLGKIGTAIVAAVATSPVTIPAFTVGTLAGATALGAAATVLSVIPAAVNVPVAFRRSIDRIKGVKYDEKALQQEIQKNSLQAREEKTQMHDLQRRISYLTPESRQTIYEGLKKEFDKNASAQLTAQTSEPAAPVAETSVVNAAAKRNAPKPS